MQQRSLTVAARVHDVRRARHELERLATHTVQIDGTAQPAVFHGVNIHFARLVLIDEADGSPYGSSLVLESNFDTHEADERRAKAEHLTALCERHGKALQPLLATCTGLDGAGGTAALAAQLLGSIAASTAEYQGHGGRDLGRIALEAEVRELARAALRHVPPSTREPRAVFEQLRGHVLRQIAATDLSIDLTQPAPSSPDPSVRAAKLRQKWLPWARHVHRALPLLPCLPYALVRESLDPVYDLQAETEQRGPADEARLWANAENEDHGAHNALTHLVAVKKGFVRRFMLRTAHGYIAALAKHHFNFVEELGGIPSIHFAKWLLIDGGKRLLFFSNYDGSWESYLGDFVDQAAIGLNLAWTCTEGYPRTRALALFGANDEERFKAWGRAHQRPTQIFYSAYPNLSVSNINNNTWLRHGLHAEGPSDVQAWLRRLT